MKTENSDITTAAPQAEENSGWVEYGALTLVQQTQVLEIVENQVDSEPQGSLLPRNERIAEVLDGLEFQPWPDGRVVRRVKPHIVESRQSNGPVAPPNPKKKRSERLKNTMAPEGAATEPVEIPQIQVITHNRIMPGPNPRTHFDPVSLQDLRNSMKARGFDPVFPLLVRKIEYRIERAKVTNGTNIHIRRNGEWVSVWNIIDKPVSVNWSLLLTDDDVKACMAFLPEYEIACGERRWRVAGEEGIGKVPAVVRALSDQEMLEIALVENIQREALNAMEEAFGYKRLLDLRDAQGQEVHTVQSIARMVGKTDKHVREYISLTRLQGSKVGEALESGRLGLAHGRLLAKMPSEASREELIQEVLDPRYGENGAMPSRELEKRITLDFVVDLRGAPFEKEDAALVPVVEKFGERIKGGACGDCPWNTKNQGEKSSRNHMCQNPECFREKIAAAHDAWAVASTNPEKKIRALTFKETEGVFHQYDDDRLSYNGAYYDLAEVPVWHQLREPNTKAKPWKQLIKGRGVEIVLARNKTGKVFEIGDKELVFAAAKENDNALPKKERIFKQEEKEGAAEVDNTIERIKQIFTSEKEGALRDSRRVALVQGARVASISDDFMRNALGVLIYAVQDQCEDLVGPARRLGFAPASEDDEDADAEKFLHEKIGKISRGEMHSLLMDLLIEIYGHNIPEKAFDTWAKVLKVDLKKAQKAAADDFSEKEKQFRKLIKCDYVKQMEEAKDASAGSKILAAYELHIHALQTMFQMPSTLGGVKDGRAVHAASTVSKKDWAAAVAQLASKSRAAAALLEILIKQYREFEPKWALLLKKEGQAAANAPAKAAKGGLSTAIAEAVKVRKMGLKDIEEVCKRIVGKAYVNLTDDDRAKVYNELLKMPIAHAKAKTTAGKKSPAKSGKKGGGK